jgi:hypothetical protein
MDDNEAVRITVDLDPDEDARLRQVTRERGQSLKAVLNDAVRAGLATKAPAYRFPSKDLGVRPHVDVDHALRLAGELEDVERVTTFPRPSSGP